MRTGVYCCALSPGGRGHDIGVNAENRLVMGTVPNVTVYELADVMKALGLVHAVGMDSGATAGLYANGYYLTQPGREVPNALIVRLRDKAPSTAAGFLDVADGYYASKAIGSLRQKGIMNGTEVEGQRLFYPESVITRAEFATVLTKAFGLKASKATKFQDVAGGWADPYVGAVAEAGYMNGYSAAEFGANDPVTEEQVIVIFSKILAKYGVQPSQPDRWLQDKPSDWAEKDVHTGIKMGLVSDTFGDDAFKPVEKAARAGVASMLDKVLNMIGK